jgi:hypothetical protein
MQGRKGGRKREGGVMVVARWEEGSDRIEKCTQALEWQLQAQQRGLAWPAAALGWCYAPTCQHVIGQPLRLAVRLACSGRLQNPRQ